MAVLTRCIVGLLCAALSSGTAFAAEVAVAANCTAPATQPAEPTPAPAKEPYNILTSDRLTGDWGGVRGPLEDAGIQIRFKNIYQFQQNFRGGLDTHHGHRFSGSYDFTPELDFERMGLIRGGSLFMQAKGSQGDGINPKVGALFDPNADSDGDNPVFMDKWWYKQFLFDKKLELRTGQIKSNKDLFDVIPYAYHEDEDFLNQIMIRSPAVPHSTGLGLFARVFPAEWLYFQAAAIDAEFRERRTGFDTAFHGRALFRGFWELGLTPQFKSERGPMPGKYYLGWWYNPQPREIFQDDLDGRRAPRLRNGDMGLYLGLAQMIWKERPEPEDLQGLAVFARGALAHRDVNMIAHSWQIGAAYTGLVPERDKDVTAFSVAQGVLSRRYRVQINELADRETVYEWYYRIQITPWCTISPDLQLITNPGGLKTGRDALVGGLRVRMEF